MQAIKLTRLNPIEVGAKESKSHLTDCTVIVYLLSVLAYVILNQSMLPVYFHSEYQI